MDEEKRSNQNYEIIESCTIGNTELVIGHNPNSPNPYVCWYCKGGSNSVSYTHLDVYKRQMTATAMR